MKLRISLFWTLCITFLLAMAVAVAVFQPIWRTRDNPDAQTATINTMPEGDETRKDEMIASSDVGADHPPAALPPASEPPVRVANLPDDVLSGASEMPLDKIPSRLTPENYNAENLITFRGPNTYRKDPIPHGVAIVNVAATDANVENLNRIFAALEIPYNLGRIPMSWSDPDHLHEYLAVVVPVSEYQKVQSVIEAACQAGVLSRKKEDVIMREATPQSG